MSTKPVIIPAPDAPVRGEDPQTFATKANRFVAWQSVSLKQNLDDSMDWVDGRVTSATGSAASASVSASVADERSTTAVEAADIALVAANVKGVWNQLSGALSVPASTFHQSKYWMLLSNVANVSAHEPGVSSVWTEIQTQQLIRTPTAIEPLSGATNVVPSPTLSANTYASVYDNDLRDYREFQVDLATGDFSTPVYTFQGDVNSHEITSTLAFDTAYKWRCRDVSQSGEMSHWMSVQDFSTGDVNITKPTLTVTGSPSSVPKHPTLSTTAFSVIGGPDTHFNTDWQILDDQSAVVWESLADAVNKLSIVVPSGVLTESTTYTFRVRHRGDVYGVSAWDSVVATTDAVFDVVPLLAVAHEITPFVTIYDQDIDTFTKLTNPAVLPASDGRGVAFSSDDTYMAVAHFNTPFITIYKRDVDVFTKLPNPAVLPAGNGLGVAFSSDDTYMAVAHGTTPFITIYKRSGDTFTKLPNPSVLPVGFGYGVAFSSDDTYMAVAHMSTPFITIYKRSGDVFTKLTNPSELPANGGYSVAFSSDDTYMAVGHAGTPYITIYKRSGDTFTKLPNPSVLPASGGWTVAFSSDDTYMAVAHGGTPFVTIYKRSGDVFTKLPNPSELPASTGRGVAFSSDDTYMAVAHYDTPFITTYKRSGDVFTKLPNPAVLPAGIGQGVAFSDVS